jgi:hypothetical protein
MALVVALAAGTFLDEPAPARAVPAPTQERAEAGPTGLIDIAVSRGVEPLSANPGNVFLYSFTRGGTLRDTVTLLPGGVFQTGQLRNISTDCLSLVAAMPTNLGDGAVLHVAVEGSGGWRELAELRLDPAHVREQRGWVPLRVDIPEGSDGLRLRFEVSAGSRNDPTADWLGIAGGLDDRCLFGPPGP